ncbi:hypothetical protein ILYODFUR_034813 [Ilyodon furcidens]|uniref:Uncharacterized protein n=1 Tax=Ilyodon furcidens TaxID=33524 RepID=A0ABV0UNW3_9TELE
MQEVLEAYLSRWNSVVLQVELAFLILRFPDVIFIGEMSATDAEMLQSSRWCVYIHPQHREPQHPEVEVRQRNAVKPVRRPGVRFINAARKNTGANHLHAEAPVNPKVHSAPEGLALSV